MNDSEIATLVRSIKQKKLEIFNLNHQREVAEKAISDEYKVDECNKKRNDLAIEFSSKTNVLYQEIAILEAKIQNEV